MISSLIKLCNLVSCYDRVSLQIKKPVTNFYEIYIEVPTSNGSNSVSFRLVDSPIERAESIIRVDNTLDWLKKFACPSLPVQEYDFRLFIYLVITIDSLVITNILLNRTINGNYFIRVEYDGDEDYGYASNYTNEGIINTCNFLLNSHLKRKNQKSSKK